jgi:hypothetical protein
VGPSGNEPNHHRSVTNRHEVRLRSDFNRLRKLDRFTRPSLMGVALEFLAMAHRRKGTWAYRTALKPIAQTTPRPLANNATPITVNIATKIC